MADDKKVTDNQQNDEEVLESIQGEVPESQLENCERERDEYKNKYLRALADYQNLDRRVRQEKEMYITTAKMSVLMEFLPFLDNLEKAEVFVKDAGLKMIKDNFLQTLKEMGIEELEVMNKEFDPHTAEAVDIVEGDKDNMVVEVLSKGFKWKDRVLRVAKVKVSKKR